MLCGNDTKLKRQIIIKHIPSSYKRISRDIKRQRGKIRQWQIGLGWLILIQLYLQYIINFYFAKYFKICKVKKVEESNYIFTLIMTHFFLLACKIEEEVFHLSWLVISRRDPLDFWVRGITSNPTMISAISCHPNISLFTKVEAPALEKQTTQNYKWMPQYQFFNS